MFLKSEDLEKFYVYAGASTVRHDYIKLIYYIIKKFDKKLI
jgi:hypothetical protein